MLLRDQTRLYKLLANNNMNIASNVISQRDVLDDSVREGSIYKGSVATVNHESETTRDLRYDRCHQS